MEELEIKLLINSDHFREIFYSNGQGNVFTAYWTKKAIIVTSILILAGLLIYFISLAYDNISWMLLLAALALFPSIVYTVIAVARYMKWRAVVKNYLNHVEKYKSCSLILTANAFELKIDGESYIEAWNKLQSCQLKPNYIKLLGATGENYFFPAKTMTAEEFEKFQGYIKRGMK